LAEETRRYARGAWFKLRPLAGDVVPLVVGTAIRGTPLIAEGRGTIQACGILCSNETNPPPSFLMSWIYLLVAGCCEIGFALALKLMDGHRNVPWTITFYVCIVLSFACLQAAVKTIPIGTAYAVWTGIGGVGVATAGMLYLGDPVTPVRIGLLVVIVAALVGLKLTTAVPH